MKLKEVEENATNLRAEVAALVVTKDRACTAAADKQAAYEAQIGELERAIVGFKRDGAYAKGWDDHIASIMQDWLNCEQALRNYKVEVDNLAMLLDGADSDRKSLTNHIGLLKVLRSDRDCEKRLRKDADEFRENAIARAELAEESLKEYFARAELAEAGVERLSSENKALRQSLRELGLERLEESVRADTAEAALALANRETDDARKDNVKITAERPLEEATWKPIEKLDKNTYNFVLAYDVETDVARLALWNPRSKQWEEAPPERMNITHYTEIPESLHPKPYHK